MPSPEIRPPTAEEAWEWFKVNWLYVLVLVVIIIIILAGIRYIMRR